MNNLINSKIGSYLLGFIWGDGCVRYNTIKIVIFV